MLNSKTTQQCGDFTNYFTTQAAEMLNGSFQVNNTAYNGLSIDTSNYQNLFNITGMATSNNIGMGGLCTDINATTWGTSIPQWVQDSSGGGWFQDQTGTTWPTIISTLPQQTYQNVNWGASFNSYEYDLIFITKNNHYLLNRIGQTMRLSFISKKNKKQIINIHFELDKTSDILSNFSKKSFLHDITHMVYAVYDSGYALTKQIVNVNFVDLNIGFSSNNIIFDINLVSLETEELDPKITNEQIIKILKRDAKIDSLNTKTKTTIKEKNS